MNNDLTNQLRASGFYIDRIMMGKVLGVNCMETEDGIVVTVDDSVVTLDHRKYMDSALTPFDFRRRSGRWLRDRKWENPYPMLTSRAHEWSGIIDQIIANKFPLTMMTQHNDSCTVLQINKDVLEEGNSIGMAIRFCGFVRDSQSKENDEVQLWVLPTIWVNPFKQR